MTNTTNRALDLSMTSARMSATVGAHSQQKLQLQLQQQPKAAGPPARFPRRRHTYPFQRNQRSCLRKTSAYCGDSARAGSRLEELSATRMITVRFGDEPKKSLSFADQHGFRLVSRCIFLIDRLSFCSRVRGAKRRAALSKQEILREYCPLDAPTEFCDLEGEELLAHRRRSNSLDRWVADSVARQHLLSMCVVSCSILGAALIGLRQASK